MKRIYTLLTVACLLLTNSSLIVARKKHRATMDQNRRERNRKKAGANRKRVAAKRKKTAAQNIILANAPQKKRPSTRVRHTAPNQKTKTQAPKIVGRSIRLSQKKITPEMRKKQYHTGKASGMRLKETVRTHDKRYKKALTSLKQDNKRLSRKRELYLALTTDLKTENQLLTQNLAELTTELCKSADAHKSTESDA